ncbi:MAG TPA: branched-chain amino acid ABC transporter permease [Treponema sp.]|nr:MAG: AzlC family protein [Treponema sp. GWA1_62_8]OHE68740.1 MAG: AzlC family protein [Treponema sp. GWC1_61_84]HCM29146.1 branched-chain amino acid ABC transporter permease [Treponema sp.]
MIPSRRLFSAAFRYSVPVLLGYLAIGIAFGLLLVDAGYPAWLALVMSLFMYAGAAQFIAVGLFASGASLAEAALITLVVNARHLAYGVSMMKRFGVAGRLKPYLVFSLTDETFALLSSLPDSRIDGIEEEDRSAFMFLVSALDQSYWVAGSVIGAVAGSLLPFKLDGLDFALTALFVVLMVEQALRVRRVAPFAISAAAAILSSMLVPSRAALLVAIGAALAAVALMDRPKGNAAEGGRPC